MRKRVPPLSVLATYPLALALAFGCSGSSESDLTGAPTTTQDARPASFPERSIPAPDLTVKRLADVEVLTEAVAANLALLAGKFRVRDFEGALDWFDARFVGDDIFHVPLAPKPRRLGTHASQLTPGSAPPADRVRWIASLEQRIGTWRNVHEARLKVKQAEFQADDTISWGKIYLQLRLLGSTEDGGRELIQASFETRVQRHGAGWQLAQLVLDHAEITRSQRELFVDVSRSAGVAHTGIRYGQAGNDSDAWNGAAAGDIDGDGRFDIFVPSSTRNFLYRNRGDGTFAEEAEARGLSSPPGGTGVVFFDVDNDGDQDLFAAHVGWLEADRSIGGATLQLYLNDGEGQFRNATAQFGLEHLGHSYSTCVFDYDLDGWLDLFVCGYGRMDRELNDSWLEASNGSPNRLYRNLGGQGFTDVTIAAGLDDHRWSYAVAAADADSDGDIDLYVANNFGSNRLYQNNSDGTFTDVASRSGIAERGNSMGVVWGDADGDGELDLFVASHASSIGSRILKRIRGGAHAKTLSALHAMTSGNTLFQRKQDGFQRLDASGSESAGWVWGSTFTDFDLDGGLDLYCANGFVTGDLPEDT